MVGCFARKPVEDTISSHCIHRDTLMAYCSTICTVTSFSQPLAFSHTKVSLKTSSATSSRPLFWGDFKKSFTGGTSAPSSVAGSIKTAAAFPSLIFSVRAFGFLPAPGLAPPRFVPSFAISITPVPLISFEKMLRPQNGAA